MKLLLGVLLIFTVYNLQSQEQVKYYPTSFNCDDVKLKTLEYIICTDKDLAKLDTVISDFYKKIREEDFIPEYQDFVKRKKGIEVVKIKENQRSWLKAKRNPCETDRECLYKVLVERAKELVWIMKTKDKIIYLSDLGLYEPPLENEEEKMNEVWESYLARGEDSDCSLVWEDFDKIEKEYGFSRAYSVSKKCDNYFWGTSEDCLYCGQWAGPMGRGYVGNLWISGDRKEMSLGIFTTDTTAKVLHRCKNIKYRVKEEISPIHVILETEPDEDGGYCIGKEVEIRLSGNNGFLGSLNYSVLSKNKSKLVKSSIENTASRLWVAFHFREIGNQEKLKNIYKDYFE